ncbi:hypothetical protein GIB67_034583 [Kingdonia uniflora]|uniref:START domain-containing protein n=1 Tax=Kingdonia uniflora TaxID=39325 RepID=A0A7J7MXE9_9MAGN|nr:hypothetical protein GIB67_034583 [Kingdonia uniflora]
MGFIWEFLYEVVLFLGPLWVAIVVGVLVGWSWKPKWAKLGDDKLDDNSAPNESSQTRLISLSQSAGFGLLASLSSLKLPIPGWSSDDEGSKKETLVSTPNDCSLQVSNENQLAVTEDDLDHLSQLVEVKDGGPAWIHMMDRSAPNMSYQAWRRDPETGPPQYRSRTVFEDARPETVRDLFWDDEFRPNWDNMLVSSSTLEECATTGTMIVRWVRKFPFFCSDREYIIGRRIWESGRSYYCVTKGVPYPSVPRCNKPRRVDLYYSSWCIRAVESNRGDGQMTACEVLLFHHEDMGIPWEIAKLGVRQGMWGTVQKIDPGLRAYQKFRASGAPISRCAVMADINIKIKGDYLNSSENSSDSSNTKILPSSSEKTSGKNLSKVLIMGGAVILACSLDRGLLSKAVIFGVARKFAKAGKRS